MAGFVEPGRQGRDLHERHGRPRLPYTRLLLPSVQVIGGRHDDRGRTTTTTDPDAAQTQEPLPKTLLTLAVTQAEAEQVLYAQRTAIAGVRRC